MNFLIRNEGQLIGTLGGVLIAILAALLTFFFSQYQSDKRGKFTYQGLLYILYVELGWHINHLKLLRATLNELKLASIRNHTFVLESAPKQVDLSIFEKGILNLIDYKHFNHGIVAFVVSYQNQIREINSCIDFKNAKELLANMNDIHDIDKRIADYFDVLDNEYTKKAQQLNYEIQKLIEKELKGYPQKI